MFAGLQLGSFDLPELDPRPVLLPLYLLRSFVRMAIAYGVAVVLALLGFRTTLRALSGAEPGPESSVRKLLGVEHDQRVSELALTLLGQEAAVDDGDAAVWAHSFLAGRCLTIAGGTSEVQRNVIAERLLGLPRDP